MIAVSKKSVRILGMVSVTSLALVCSAGHSCLPACSCPLGMHAFPGPAQRAGSPRRPNASSTPLLPSTVPPRKAAPGCALRRSALPVPTPAPSDFLLQLLLLWLVPSSSFRRSRSSACTNLPNLQAEPTCAKNTARYQAVCAVPAGLRSCQRSGISTCLACARQGEISFPALQYLLRACLSHRYWHRGRGNAQLFSSLLHLGQTAERYRGVGMRPHPKCLNASKAFLPGRTPASRHSQYNHTKCRLQENSSYRPPANSTTHLPRP